MFDTEQAQMQKFPQVVLASSTTNKIQHFSCPMGQGCHTAAMADKGIYLPTSMYIKPTFRELF